MPGGRRSRQIGQLVYARAQVGIARGEMATPVTRDGGYLPRWSPKGERIAYLGEGGMWLVNGNGTDRRELAAGQFLAMAWSAEGDAAYALRNGERLEVMKVAVDTGRAAVVADLGLSPASLVFGWAAGREPVRSFSLARHGAGIEISLLRPESDVWTVAGVHGPRQSAGTDTCRLSCRAVSPRGGVGRRGLRRRRPSLPGYSHPPGWTRAPRRADPRFPSGVGEGGEVLVGEGKPAKRIPGAGIETGGDQDQIRAKSGGCGEQNAAEGSRISAAPAPAGKGQLMVVPAPEPSPVSEASPVPGYQGDGGAEEQHGTVGVEGVLSAVAVVHVPIDDEDAFGRMLTLRIPRRDRHIIENAKAHAARGCGGGPGAGRSRRRWRPCR